MLEYVIMAVVLGGAVGLTVLANRAIREMKDRGIPTGQGGCSGNPNCPLRELEREEKQPSAPETK